MLIFALGLKLHPPLGGGVGELFATNLFIHIYFSLFNWRLNFENQLPRLPGRALTVTTVRYSRFYPFVMFLNPEPYCLILCESCGPVGGIGAPRNRDIERTHFSYKPSLILKILCSLQISNLFLKCQEWLRNGRSTLMLQNWNILSEFLVFGTKWKHGVLGGIYGQQRSALESPPSLWVFIQMAMERRLKRSMLFPTERLMID